jgi:hypothetical protein
LRSAASRSPNAASPSMRERKDAIGLFTSGSAIRMSENATSAATTWRVARGAKQGSF